MFHSQILSIPGVFNNVSSLLYSTRVVVGFLALSDFTPSGGAFSLTFVTNLIKQKKIKKRHVRVSNV